MSGDPCGGNVRGGAGCKCTPPFGSEVPTEILTEVLRVLKPSGVERWTRTPIPALHNATPQQIIAAGSVDKLLAYVRTYSDQAST